MLSLFWWHYSRIIANFVSTMKMLLFIISFVLSCYFNSDVISAKENYDGFSSTIVETAAQDDNNAEPNLYSNAILPSRAARSFGENGGNTLNLRSNNPVRRIQVSQKFPFRIIKAGKIIDIQHFSVFQTIFYLFPSGIKTISRYIHIICQLLI